MELCSVFEPRRDTQVRYMGDVSHCSNKIQRSSGWLEGPQLRTRGRHCAGRCLRCAVSRERYTQGLGLTSYGFPGNAKAAVRSNGVWWAARRKRTGESCPSQGSQWWKGGASRKDTPLVPGQEPKSVHGITIGREKLHNKYTEEPTLGTVLPLGKRVH